MDKHLIDENLANMMEMSSSNKLLADLIDLTIDEKLEYCGRCANINYDLSHIGLWKCLWSEVDRVFIAVRPYFH